MSNDFARMVADYLSSRDAKDERQKLRPWTLVYALACFVALFIAVDSAYGQTVVHSYEEKGKVAVQLLNAPCTDEFSLMVLSQAPQYMSRAKGLTSQWLHSDDQKMHPYGGCWVEFSKEEAGGEAVFFLMFADGQRIVVPKTQFTKKPGTVGV